MVNENKGNKQDKTGEKGADLAADYVAPEIPTGAGNVIAAAEKRFWFWAKIIIISAITIVFIFCVVTGYYNCSWQEAFMCLLHGILDRIFWILEIPAKLIPGLDYTIPNPIAVTWSSNVDIVVWNVRVIRIIAVVFIGGGLSVSGASYQCLFRNPLVSESILGVSNGACLGASLAILLDLNSVLINFFAFAGGSLAVFLTYYCSKVLRGNQTLLLVLSGMVISSLFSAGVAIIKYVAPTDTALPEITYWQMGSFAKISQTDLYYLIPIVVICVLMLVRIRWRMNILSLGDREAKTLGVNVQRTRAIIIVCSTLIASVCTCVCGTISWVGVIIPQIVRQMVGPDARKLIPCTFFTGAVFMMLSDLACRATSVGELPVSVVTSVIGAPVFFIILFRTKSGWA